MKTNPQIKSGTDGLHKPNEDQNPNRIPPRWSSKARMMKPSPIEPPINQNIKNQTYTKKKKFPNISIKLYYNESNERCLRNIKLGGW